MKTENASISYVVPCYNEPMEMVESTVKSIQELDPEGNSEIILVNDGSDIDYSQLAERLGIVVCHHRTNKGYGAAITTGIKKARHDWIAITDADASYPLERFVDLNARAKGYDMVIGARHWSRISWPKKPAKLMITKLASYISSVNIPDLNSGMRIFRREIYEEYKRFFPAKFSFSSTLTMVALTQGFEVTFVPIGYKKRVGKSKIRPLRDTMGFITQLLRLALYFNPMKVFIPLSILIMLASIGRGIRDVWITNALGGIAQLLFVLSIQIFFFGLLAEIINKK